MTLLNGLLGGLKARRKMLALGGAVALALAGPALAGGYYPGFPNPALPMSGNESWPVDSQLPSGAQPQTENMTMGTLEGYSRQTSGSGGFRNSLNGGDFGTNLWQRGTTASADISNTLTYYADGFWNLGGASSAIDVTKETGASDITQGYAASMRFQRKAANTDVVPICFGQVLTSNNSTKYQGHVAELSFHGLAGANFSAAGSVVTVTIGYGTSANDTAANFASGSWAGYVGVAQATTITTTWGRYSAIAAIPVTATQLGVKVCYTPVGTAGANDWVETTGVQLDLNDSADANDGNGGSYSIASFERRPAMLEASLEYGYYYQLAETNGGYFAPGIVSATNVERAVLNLPTVMRATPTCTFTAGGLKWNLAGTQTSVGTLTQVTGSTAAQLTIGDTVTGTAGGVAFLNGSNTTGAVKCSAEL